MEHILRTSARPLRHPLLNPTCDVARRKRDTRGDKKALPLANLKEQKATKGRGTKKRREWENRSRGAGKRKKRKKKKKRREEGKLHKDATLRCAARWTWRGRKISRGRNSRMDGYRCVYMCTYTYRDHDGGLKKPLDLNGTRGKTELRTKRRGSFVRATDRSGLAGRPANYLWHCPALSIRE